VLVVQSWLIGVGWVVYGGQLLGCWFYDVWLRAWADSRWGHEQPGTANRGGGQGRSRRLMSGGRGVGPALPVKGSAPISASRGEDDYVRFHAAVVEHRNLERHDSPES
jgi:hypothetical protein